MKPVPAEKASRSDAMDEFGSPASMAAVRTEGAYEEDILPFIIASRTADPNAPPKARAEKANPVAVLRYSCGAVNWTRATSSVKGPD